jgi:hypothetical protein
MSNPTNEQELDINRIEGIIADHNRAMRADIASEIAGGIRSKAITDVITVKAIIAHTNAEIAKVLDRLEQEQFWAADDQYDAGQVVSLEAIQAERAKLKEVK